MSRFKETKTLADRITKLSGLDEMNKSIMADVDKPRSRPKGSRFGMFMVVNTALGKRDGPFETKEMAQRALQALNNASPNLAKSRKIVRIMF